MVVKSSSLEIALNQFRSKYKGLQVFSEPIELTECFRNLNGELKAPKNYGDLETNVVLGYVALGACFMKKYVREEGAIKLKEGHYEIIQFDEERKALSCLCIEDIKSTSLAEIDEEHKVQGFLPWQVHNLSDKLKQSYSQFDPKKDTALFFSDRRNRVYFKTKLSATWLNQIVNLGAKCLDKMNRREYELMQKLFPDAVLRGEKLAIEQRSYMYGRELHTSESVEFLERKITTYQKWNNL